MIINTDVETMFFFFQCYESPPDSSDTEDLDVNFGTKRKRGFVSRLAFIFAASALPPLPLFIPTDAYKEWLSL